MDGELACVVVFVPIQPRIKFGRDPGRFGNLCVGARQPIGRVIVKADGDLRRAVETRRRVNGVVRRGDPAGQRRRVRQRSIADRRLDSPADPAQRVDPLPS
jgi:hypothetical protein